MRAVIEARCMAKPRGCCNACGDYRRLALIDIQSDSSKPPEQVYLCAGCVRGALAAAISHRRPARSAA